MKNYEVDGTLRFQLPIDDTNSSIPTLSNKQKDALQSLITDYLNNKSKFVYDGSFRRESYAYPNSVSSLNGSTNGCMYKGDYIMNCGIFAQMIWMGRNIKDFKSDNLLHAKNINLCAFNKFSKGEILNADSILPMY